MIIDMPKTPSLVVREYDKTIEYWIEEMKLSDGLKTSVLNSEIVFIPCDYKDAPNAFTDHTYDFYNYCIQKAGFRVEICCEEQDFNQLEMCSLKVRLGRFFSVSSISGVILWNIISGYIKDSIDYRLEKVTENMEQVEEIPAYQSEPECSFSVIIRDTTGRYIEVFYDGPISGMEEAGDQIKKITNE